RIGGSLGRDDLDAPLRFSTETLELDRERRAMLGDPGVDCAGVGERRAEAEWDDDAARTRFEQALVVGAHLAFELHLIVERALVELAHDRPDAFADADEGDELAATEVRHRPPQQVVDPQAAHSLPRLRPG